MIEKQFRQDKIILDSKTILNYLITEKSEIEKVLLGSPGNNIKLTTSDLAVYEALGSVMEPDNFNWRNVVKFLEAVQVVSHENVTGRKKPILTQKRVEEIRKEALK